MNKQKIPFSVIILKRHYPQYMGRLQWGMNHPYFVQHFMYICISGTLYNSWCVWGTQYRFAEWMKGLFGLSEAGIVDDFLPIGSGMWFGAY